MIAAFRLEIYQNLTKKYLFLQLEKFAIEVHGFTFKYRSYMKDIALFFSLLKTLRSDVYKIIESNPEMTALELAEYVFNRIDDLKKLN